jgi:hypothetical protein
MFTLFLSLFASTWKKKAGFVEEPPHVAIFHQPEHLLKNRVYFCLYFWMLHLADTRSTYMHNQVTITNFKKRQI